MDLYKRFFLLANDLFLVTNGKGRIEHVNDRWKEVMGFEASEVEGKMTTDFLHPDDVKRNSREREIMYGAPRGTQLSFENRLIHRDGSIVHLRWTGLVDPETDFFYATAKDITKTRNMSNELAENRQLLDAIMRYSPSVMHVKGRDARYLLVNRNFEERVRHLSPSFVGKTPHDVFPKRIADQMALHDQEIYRTRRAQTFEEEQIHQDGIHIYLSSKFPLFDDAGEIVGVGGISTDISDLVRERERSTILRQLIESSRDGFGYCDPELRTLYLNRFLTEEMGWRIEKNLLEYLSPRSLALVKKSVLPAIQKNGDPWEGDVEVTNAITGELVPIWMKIFTSYGDEKKTKYIAFFATDQRNKKSAEAAILHSSKMASLGQMAAGVAHEVNNPITIIHGTAGLLKRAVGANQLDPEKLAAGLERIERTAIRISRIVKGLRMFTRSGQNDPFTPSSLEEIFEETLDLCRERFRDHQIDLRLAPIPKVSLRCRPTQISQVLLNLLNNAFDAVSVLNDRWVEIGFSYPNPETIEISVTDSGPKITPDVQKRLMEPFFTTKEPGKGTGLGLPISRRIVEEHKGVLHYDPLSENTRFVIELPL